MIYPQRDSISVFLPAIKSCNIEHLFSEVESTTSISRSCSSESEISIPDARATDSDSSRSSCDCSHKSLSNRAPFLTPDIAQIGFIAILISSFFQIDLEMSSVHVGERPALSSALTREAITSLGGPPSRAPSVIEPLPTQCIPSAPLHAP